MAPSENEFDTPALDEHCFPFSSLQVVLGYFCIQDSAIPTLHSSPLSITVKSLN